MAFKPWRYIPREVAVAKRAKQIRSAIREVDQDAGSALSKAEERLAEIARGMPKKALNALDVPGDITTGALTAPFGRLEVGADGKAERRFSRGSVLSGVKEHALEFGTLSLNDAADSRIEREKALLRTTGQLETNPLKSLRQQGQQFEQAETVPTGVRVGVRAALDPTNLVPVGSVGKALKFAPAGVRASRGARVAADLIETSPRVALASAAGAGFGSEAADKFGAPDWVGALAGGVAGGGLAAAKHGRPTARVAAMVDYQHPKADAYLETLDTYDIPYEFDAEGVIRPDMKRLEAVRGDLLSEVRVSEEPRGIYAPQTSEWVEVGGKQVRRRAKKLGTEPGKVDVDAAVHLERLDELLADNIPDAAIEEGRRARIQSADEERLAAEFPPPPPKSERALKMAATRAAKAEAASAAKAEAARGPKMLRDGAYTVVKRADATSERFFTPKGVRGDKGRAAANALLEAEDAKWRAQETLTPEPEIKEKPVSLKSGERDMFGNEVVPPPVETSQPKLDLAGGSRGLKVPSNQADFLAEANRPEIPESSAAPRGFDGAPENPVPLDPALTAAADVPPPPKGIGPGNMQPELGQEKTGADLLQLLGRDEAVAKEMDYLGTRAGQWDQKIRETTARILAPLFKRGGREGGADNLVRDPRITPIFQGLNQAENNTAHLMAVVEDKLHALQGAGLRIVQREDGNWVEDESGLPWSDIIERDSDAARAAWDALPADVKAKADDLVGFQRRANETVQRYGGNVSLLQHEGEHWPRRVESIAGVEKARGSAPSRRVGSTRGFEKARSVGTAAEGADRQIAYVHPFDAYETAFREKMRSATDSWVESMVKPLAVKGTGNFATLNVPGQPGLANLQFDPSVAGRLQRGLEGSKPGAIEAAVRGVNSVLTPIRASLDASATFQQGLRMWLKDPKEAARLWKTVAASLKDPEKYFAARAQIDAEIGDLLSQAGIEHNGGIEYLATHGLRQTGKDAEHEFALPRVSGRLEKVAKPYNKAAEISQDHFDRLLNLYRLESGRDLLARQLAAGNVEQKELRKGMLALNRAFGWSDNKPTSLESIAFFAPRFFRSNLETLYQSVAGKGLAREVAQDHLARMMGSAVAVTVAVNEARGYETEFRPWNPNFMRMRNLGGVDVSILGPYDTLLRYAAQAATGNPGAIPKLLESKASPVVGMAGAQIKGRTYLGEPLDSPQARIIETFKGMLPFPVTNVIEEGIDNRSPKDALVSGAVGALGLKNNPVTPSERLGFLREGHKGITGLRKIAGEAENRFGASYDSLTGAQKSVVNENPKIQRAQAEADRRASKGESDRADQVRIQQQVRDELDASAKYLAAGVDATGKRYTGNDFRKAYNDTMLRAAGARQLIGRKGNGALDRWFALYDQARMDNGQVDYDKLERLQGEFRASNPNIDREVEKLVGARDNAAVRELREARKLASQYYAIPQYRGMSLEDSEKASQVLTIAADMVKFGQARNRGHALRMLREEGRGDEVQLARVALRRKANPERAAFRKSNELFAKYYSEASAGS